MPSRNGLFTATAVIEAGTGLALLLVPSAVIRLLFGVADPSATALTAGRVVGLLLLALGAAAWLSDGSSGRSARPALLYGMLAYNVGIGVALATVALVTGLSGVLLWPAVVLHSAMAVWCVVYLRSTHRSHEVSAT